MLSSKSSDGEIYEVDEPQDNDVLLGRSRKAANWAGNIRFRELVKTWAVKYNSSMDPHARDIIANQVIASIKDNGGRFLQLQESKCDDDERGSRWVIVADGWVRTKVKQALRDVTKVSRNKRRRSAGVDPSLIEARDLEPRPIEQMVQSASASQNLSDQAIASFDLEPRPIEEMVRSASLSQIFDSNRDLSSQQQQMLHRQFSTPIDRQHQSQAPPTVFPHISAAHVYPHLQQPHLQQPQLQLPTDPTAAIWKLQQDILYGRVASREERQAPFDRIRQEQHSSIAPFGSEPMEHATSGRGSNSADLLDEAIQAQIGIDEVGRDISVEDHSTVGSSIFDDDESSEDARKPSATGSRPSSSD